MITCLQSSTYSAAYLHSPLLIILYFLLCPSFPSQLQKNKVSVTPLLCPQLPSIIDNNTISGDYHQQFDHIPFSLPIYLTFFYGNLILFRQAGKKSADGKCWQIPNLRCIKNQAQNIREKQVYFCIVSTYFRIKADIIMEMFTKIYIF